MLRGRSEFQGAKSVPPKVREAIRIVEEDGWYHVRTRGSHRHFHRPVKTKTVTIPGRLGEDLRQSTWSSILKQAELPKDIWP